MKKSEAIELFGTQTALAKAIGFERQNITQWPATLTHKQALYVLGAGLVAGIPYCKLKELAK